MVSQTRISDGSAASDEPVVDPLMRNFVGADLGYYALRFDRLARTGLGLGAPNWAAVIGGPIWAATRGLWTNFWILGVAEAIALIIAARDMTGVASGGAAVGIPMFLALRLGHGLLADWSYFLRYRRWRLFGRGHIGASRSAALVGGLLWASGTALLVYRFAWPQVWSLLVEFPTDSSIAATFAVAIDTAVKWMVREFATLFDAITAVVREILNFLELVFVGTPWPLTALILLLIAWRVAGRRVLIFATVALVYIGLFGYWAESMRTLALVATSTLICMALGMPVGVWCAKSRRVDAVVRPILDVMQTMPSFVYLIPAIAFFSIGKVPGVLATVVFSVPPMVRLTALGVVQVPRHVTEAAVAFGASPRQLLFKIELPLAVPSIMAGINQTIMMCLSMVVIASLIGAGGLGDHIIRALRYAETGKGLLAGIAIVLCAMILDRIVQASSLGRHRR